MDLQLDAPHSMGTTIVGVTYNGGVVLGADSRTSTGMYVANRASDKITQLTDNVYVCRSGSEICKGLSKDVTIVFVLGGPGSGKGTQSSIMAKHYGFIHLSAGDLLRKEKETNIDIATLIENNLKEGKLVPSDIMVNLLRKAMQESDNDKFLIDGFPRNKDNLLAFESLIGIEPKCVLYLACSEEVMTQRLLNRNQGREDDNIETIRNRITLFFQTSLPIVEDYYSKGKLLKINGEKSVEEVFEEIKNAF